VTSDSAAVRQLSIPAVKLQTRATKVRFWGRSDEEINKISNELDYRS